MKNLLRYSLMLFAVVAICSIHAPKAYGQALAPAPAAASASATLTAPSAAHTDERKDETARLSALEEAVKQQHSQLEQLQQLLVEQQETIKQLTAKLTGPIAAAPRDTLATSSGATAESPGIRSTEPQTPTVEDRLKKVEGRISELGGIKFSGDIRVRSESFFGASNNLATGNSTTEIGNDLSPRHRMRIRARLAMRGTITDEFDWGLRFSTGSFADNISTNQTLTDFFNRKPFALDQAFITYKPKSLPGLRLQGGKFELPWNFTEMTFDNDLMVDGFNESYTKTFKDSKVRELSFVAWQLPLLERNSAFVRNSDGTVNIERSARDGKDLALFGGQSGVGFELFDGGFRGLLEVVNLAGCIGREIVPAGEAIEFVVAVVLGAFEVPGFVRAQRGGKLGFHRLAVPGRLLAGFLAFGVAVIVDALTILFTDVVDGFVFLACDSGRTQVAP